MLDEAQADVYKEEWQSLKADLHEALNSGEARYTLLFSRLFFRL